MVTKKKKKTAVIVNSNGRNLNEKPIKFDCLSREQFNVGETKIECRLSLFCGIHNIFVEHFGAMVLMHKNIHCISKIMF